MLIQGCHHHPNHLTLSLRSHHHQTAVFSLCTNLRQSLTHRYYLCKHFKLLFAFVVDAMLNLKLKAAVFIRYLALPTVEVVVTYLESSYIKLECYTWLISFKDLKANQNSLFIKALLTKFSTDFTISAIFEFNQLFF